MKKKVLVSTFPFCEFDRKPLDLLAAEDNFEVTLNPFDRKIKEVELVEMIEPYDAIIAGTEPISAQVLERAKKLKIISRVGVGLDSVDLLAAKIKKISVSYTAEAPAPAVAELTLGLMLNLIRHVDQANKLMHQGGWKRFFGARLGESKIGVLGCGRIGRRVVEHLKGFSPKSILVHDLAPLKIPGTTDVDFSTLISESDIITVHTPLTRSTRGLIDFSAIGRMKKNTVLINTARGGIINENDLWQALKEKKIQSAAVDVFESEPYDGPLKELENCLMTSHMGSMSFDCRSRMEIEATQEVIGFFKNGTSKQPVPETEYELRKN